MTPDSKKPAASSGLPGVQLAGLEHPNNILNGEFVQRFHALGPLASTESACEREAR